MQKHTIGFDDGHIYEFTPDLEPAITIEPGTQVRVETIDSLEGAIQEPTDHLDGVPDEVNAATGPIEVSEAQPGDIIQVSIQSIEVAEDRGRVVTTPGFGLLQNDSDIEHPATKITPVEGDTVAFDDLEVDISPVIGTMGVAPRTGAYSTLVPDDHGGNLDTADITEGAVVYFPVFQPGAMLAMGDAKAAMAQGEMCGTGAEIALSIDIEVTVIKEPEIHLERPLVETATAWKTIASGETLEDAARMATRDMLSLLQAAQDFTRTEAYLFASLVGGLEISQVVNPFKTVRCGMPKEYLDDPFTAKN